jgi:hypothetical protein
MFLGQTIRLFFSARRSVVLIGDIESPSAAFLVHDYVNSKEVTEFGSLGRSYLRDTIEQKVVFADVTVALRYHPPYLWRVNRSSRFLLYVDASGNYQWSTSTPTQVVQEPPATEIVEISDRPIPPRQRAPGEIVIPFRFTTP